MAAPPTATIYVANLPRGTDEELLAEHFGSIGLVKVCRPRKQHTPYSWS